jgi:hypothetical protein
MVIRLRDVFLSLLLLAVILGANALFSDAPDFRQIIFTYAIIVLAHLFFALNQKPHARVGKDGWRYLTPSKLDWIGALGCFVLTAVFLYVFFFVGSARADAAMQMFWLKLLILSFGTMTVISVLYLSNVRVRWNDHCIQTRTMFLQYKTIPWTDMAAAGMGWGQHVWVESSDGTKIRFSSYQNGAEELAQTVLERGSHILPAQ